MMRYVESLNLALNDLMAQNSEVILIEKIFDPYGARLKRARDCRRDIMGASDFYADLRKLDHWGRSRHGTSRMQPIVEIISGDYYPCTDQIARPCLQVSLDVSSSSSGAARDPHPHGWAPRLHGPTHSQSLESLYLSVPWFTHRCTFPDFSPSRAVASRGRNGAELADPLRGE